MSLTRSDIDFNLIQDSNVSDDLITIKKKKSKKDNKKRGRGNEDKSMTRKHSRTSRPETEPTVSSKSAQLTVFPSGGNGK